MSARRTREVFGCIGVLAAVALAAYWHVAGDETYMRLAIGRFIAAEGLGASADPWLYSRPAPEWRNLEWLGDLLLFTAWRAGGEAALVASKLALLGAGWLMLYALGRRAGGSPVVLLALVCLVMAGTEQRLTERNEMHVYWLIPAYGWVLERARQDRRWLLGLLPLGAAWANLHGSFMLGWVMVGAAFLDALLGAERDPARARALALACAVHPLLALVHPDGLRVYAFVLDHGRHAELIKATVSEWAPPDRLPATLARLPLHLFGVLALLSFLPRPNRRQVQGFLLTAAGLVMAHSSQRFFLVFGVLAIPAVAANLRRLAGALPARRGWLAPAGAALALAGSVALLVPAARAARAYPTARDRTTKPSRPAAWLAQHAPAGSRLFNPYSGSQWLMWEAPRVGLYVHAYFSYAGQHFLDFLRVVQSPPLFEREVERLGITLVMTSYADETQHLFGHVVQSPRWRLVYWDGVYGIHARDRPEAALFVARHGYEHLRPFLGFEYLDAVSEDALAADLARLAAQGPAAHQALRGFRLLTREGAGPAELAQARDLLAAAAAALPSPSFVAYLVQAHRALGEREQAEAALRAGLARFPGAPRLTSLAAPDGPARR